jgi:hypothetical protein
MRERTHDRAPRPTAGHALSDRFPSLAGMGAIAFDLETGAPHLTVHDELDGSYHDDKAGREALRELKHLMETCVELRVPLRVDAGTGPNWGSCE